VLVLLLWWWMAVKYKCTLPLVDVNEHVCPPLKCTYGGDIIAIVERRLVMPSTSKEKSTGVDVGHICAVFEEFYIA
jgi:hypothetical protein